MAPTLKDISFLLGLPLEGTPVGPVDGLHTWKPDITQRFAGVMRMPGLEAIAPLPFYMTHGPTKKWLNQFTIETMHPDADEYTVSRCLEADLLWLFGWVMFCGTYGNSVGTFCSIWR